MLSTEREGRTDSGMKITGPLLMNFQSVRMIQQVVQLAVDGWAVTFGTARALAGCKEGPWQAARKGRGGLRGRALAGCEEGPWRAAEIK